MADLIATQIARICHEANRALQLALGEEPSPHWEHAPESQRRSAERGVVLALNTEVTDEGLHASWSDQKIAEGWRWGPVKDEGAKTHPCLVRYADLPEAQRLKDTLFRSVVGAFKAVG